MTAILGEKVLDMSSKCADYMQLMQEVFESKGASEKQGPDTKRDGGLDGYD